MQTLAVKFSCGETTGLCGILMWQCHRRDALCPNLTFLQGTLDLMVLQTLAAMGSLHGYGIARRIEQVSGNQVLLNQGTIYASLVRLEQRGWIASSLGHLRQQSKGEVLLPSPPPGRRQLAADAHYWERLTGVMDRVLAMGNAADEEAGPA